MDRLEAASNSEHAFHSPPCSPIPPHGAGWRWQWHLRVCSNLPCSSFALFMQRNGSAPVCVCVCVCVCACISYKSILSVDITLLAPLWPPDWRQGNPPPLLGTNAAPSWDQRRSALVARFPIVTVHHWGLYTTYHSNIPLFQENVEVVKQTLPDNRLPSVLPPQTCRLAKPPPPPSRRRPNHRGPRRWSMALAGPLQRITPSMKSS